MKSQKTIRLSLRDVVCRVHRMASPRIIFFSDNLKLNPAVIPKKGSLRKVIRKRRDQFNFSEPAMILKIPPIRSSAGWRQIYTLTKRVLGSFTKCHGKIDLCQKLTHPLQRTAREAQQDERTLSQSPQR